MSDKQGVGGARQRPAWRRVAFFGVLLLLLPCFSEGILRARGWHQRTVPKLVQERAREQYRPNSRLGFDGRRFFSLAAGHRESGKHAGRAPTDAWPFRGRPQRPAVEGQQRVFVLGDSGVHGVQLFEADTLPTRIAAELASLGFGTGEVAVLNFGVPGYSTLQIKELLAEQLGALEPSDVLVLSTSLWNDRAPATGPVSQSELLRALKPNFLQRLLPACSARLAWIRWGGNPLRTPVASSELRASWRRGEAPFGTLVPRAEALTAMSWCVELALGRGCPVIAVVPAYPKQSLRDHRGLAADVEALARTYEQAGAHVLDGPSLLAESGLQDGAAFLDEVHPSGPWNRVLAAAIAVDIVPALGASARSSDLNQGGQLQDSNLHASNSHSSASSKLEVLSVIPKELSALGDQTLELRVRGLTPGGLPLILIGGQPLLDVAYVRTAGSAFEDQASLRITGRTGADRPGEYDLYLESGDERLTLPAAIRRNAPRLEVLAGEAKASWLVHVVSRPGDLVLGLWAGKPVENNPGWSLEGDILLAPGSQALECEPVACGPDGFAILEVHLPASAPGATTYLQARVLPGGLSPTLGRHVPGIASTSAALPGADVDQGRNSDQGLDRTGNLRGDR